MRKIFLFMNNSINKARFYNFTFKISSSTFCVISSKNIYCITMVYHKFNFFNNFFILKICTPLFNSSFYEFINIYPNICFIEIIF